MLDLALVKIRHTKMWTPRVAMAMLRHGDGVIGLAMSTAIDSHKYGLVGAITRWR